MADELTPQQRQLVVDVMREWPKIAGPQELLDRLDRFAKGILATVTGEHQSTEIRRSNAAEAYLRAAAERDALELKLQAMLDAAEMLWIVLANVSGGAWSQQTPEWQEAAAKWRDQYFDALRLATRGRPGGIVIEIHPSPTADTRTCDYANVTKETLLASSRQHIYDVRRALQFFVTKLGIASMNHDTDKITDIDGFHADFVTGFVQTGWWTRHRQLNRHHLLQEDGVPADVNLIDVLDLVADCVMAGMARSGSVNQLPLSPEVLQRAFENTVELLKAQVKVIPDQP